MQQQETESQQISALMPEKTLENDQSFMDTLLAVQKSIEDATTTDAIAALGAGTPRWIRCPRALKELGAVLQHDRTAGTTTNAATFPPSPRAWIFPPGNAHATSRRHAVPYKPEKGHEEQQAGQKPAGSAPQAGLVQRRPGRRLRPRHADRGEALQKAIGMEEDGIATPELRRVFSPTTRARRRQDDPRPPRPRALPGAGGREAPSA
jgi:hypothetical protein